MPGRIHGTLTRWNDDRGFGFIKPAKGEAELFVHISAFPRDGVRPRINELISFETEAGKDGRPRAVRVMRPGTPSVSKTTSRGAPPTRKSHWLGGVISFLVIVGLGVPAYDRFKESRLAAQPVAATAEEETVAAPPAAQQMTVEPAVEPAEEPVVTERQYPDECDGRTMCSEMTSCDEARFFIQNCPGTKMDGNRDGVPCESQWCN